MVNYSVLVVGCDKNKKLLDRFFKQFSRFWSDKSIPVYLSMEEDGYSYEGLDIKVTICGKIWTDRVKKTLEIIKTDAVLLLLDDFLIEEPVDCDEINKLAGLICTDDSIAHFALTTVPMKNQSDSLYFDKYYLRHRFGRYKTTLQAGMWNRNEFISVCGEGESAWSFETSANFRSYLSNRNYYAIADKKFKPISYNDGLFCIQGKVNTHELERLNEKFDEDFSIEGMPDNGGIIIRDPCPFFKRIIRRIKLNSKDAYYRLRWFLSKWKR